jgi:hypothetical protein
MSTREIPRDEWVAFFDSFSRQHEGWLASVEVFGLEFGAQEEAHELPLRGIIADLKGGDDDTISIIAGDRPEDHVTHTVVAPKRVRLEETAEGGHRALEIVAASGVTTLLRFRSAVLPEMVDGVVSE